MFTCRPSSSLIAYVSVEDYSSVSGQIRRVSLSEEPLHGGDILKEVRFVVDKTKLMFFGSDFFFD